MGLTRRALVGTLALPLAAQEWRRYADPATEADVLRMTDPEHSSLLPASPGRAVSKRSRELLYASDQGGRFAPWILDLSNGAARALASLERMDPAALTFSFDDKEAFAGDGAKVVAIQLATGRLRDVYETPAPWARTGPIGLSDDGTALNVVERQAGRSRVVRVRLPKGAAWTVCEQPGEIGEAVPNPRRAMVLWLALPGELWVAGYDGTGARKLETPAGRVLDAQWAPDGQSIQYLHEPAETTQLNAIREQGLDDRKDALLAKTSQFMSFSRNANGSVFVGASRSKASPNVLVLLRATRREFTLCEHKATDAALVRPVFAPNSQRILFQSDRHGKPAIYMMNVERLLEKTDS